MTLAESKKRWRQRNPEKELEMERRSNATFRSLHPGYRKLLKERQSLPPPELSPRMEALLQRTEREMVKGGTSE